MKRNTIKSAVITAVGLLMLFSGLLIVKRFNLGSQPLHICVSDLAEDCSVMGLGNY